MFIIKLVFKGIFEFKRSYHSVYETIGQVKVVVVRRNGTSGDIDVPWTTKTDSAIDWEDYEGASGTLRFGASEVGALLCII